MTPLWAVSLRFLVAALSIYPFLVLNRIFLKRPIVPPAMPWRVVVAVGLLQTAGSTGFLNLGLRTTSAPKAAILMACTPLMVALLSGIVFREKIRPLALLGLLISFVGVVLCIAGLKLTAH